MVLLKSKSMNSKLLKCMFLKNVIKTIETGVRKCGIWSAINILAVHSMENYLKLKIVMCLWGSCK